MNNKKIAFHIHSNHSDGLFSVKRILSEAKKRKFTYISITDHNTISGSLEAIRLAEKYGVKIIPGIEISFTYNNKFTDLITLFYNEKDMKDFFKEFMGEKRLFPNFTDLKDLEKLFSKYHAIVIPPHPFAHKGAINHNVLIDYSAIEAINATEKVNNNEAATNYQKEKGLIGVSGCDLHHGFNVLKTFTMAESEKELNLNNILDSLNGKNNDIRFKIINKYNKPKFFNPLDRILSLLLYSRFLIKLIFR